MTRGRAGRVGRYVCVGVGVSCRVGLRERRVPREFRCFSDAGADMALGCGDGMPLGTGVTLGTGVGFGADGAGDGGVVGTDVGSAVGGALGRVVGTPRGRSSDGLWFP